jgi:CheY-like chemotaxis protein
LPSYPSPNLTASELKKMKMTQHTKNTILWADDDPDDIYLIRQVLAENDHNYNIIEFQNGKEIIEYLSALSASSFPCLIVLDINMPVMDGKQTLSYLKKHPQFQTIPVAMFTTSNSQTDKLFCTHFGAEMITKPSSFPNFKSSVDHLMKHCLNKVAH